MMHWPQCSHNVQRPWILHWRLRRQLHLLHPYPSCENLPMEESRSPCLKIPLCHPLRSPVYERSKNPYIVCFPLSQRPCASRVEYLTARLVLPWLNVFLDAYNRIQTINVSTFRQNCIWQRKPCSPTWHPLLIFSCSRKIYDITSPMLIYRHH